MSGPEGEEARLRELAADYRRDGLIPPAAARRWPRGDGARADPAPVTTIARRARRAKERGVALEVIRDLKARDLRTLQAHGDPDQQARAALALRVRTEEGPGRRTTEGERTLAALARCRCRRAPSATGREHLQFVPLAVLPQRGKVWATRWTSLHGRGAAPGSLPLPWVPPVTGAGKTTQHMQMLDATRPEEQRHRRGPGSNPPDQAPVAIYSEMAEDDLEDRTLANHPARRNRPMCRTTSSRRVAARRRFDTEKAWVDDQFNRAAAAMAPGGAYHQITEWQRFTRAGKLAGPSLVRAIEADVSAWVDDLKRAHPGRDIVPIVAMDPIQSFLPVDAGRSEIETLGEMAAALDELADRRRWVVLITVETNKTSAVAAAGKEGTGGAAAAVFRGTMQLLHRLDVALVLDTGKEDPGGVCEATLTLDKNRAGPSSVSTAYRWQKRTGLRFVPETKEEHTKKVAAKRAAADPATQTDNLCRVILDLTDPTKNLYATEKKLRGRVEEIGTAEKKLPALLADAIKAGRIRQSEAKKGQGGGFPYEVVE